MDETDRLSLLAPVREYIRRLQVCKPEDRAAAMDFYLRLITECSAQVSAEASADVADRLKPELRNIEASIQDALERSPHAAAGATLAHAQLMLHTGLGSTAFLERILDALPADRRERAPLARTIGMAALARVEYPTAQARLTQAMALFAGDDDRRDSIACRRLLGDVALADGRREEAAALYRAAAVEYRQLGHVGPAEDCEQRVELTSLKGTVAAPVEERVVSVDRDGEAMFIDLLPQITRIGGYISRSRRLSPEDHADFASYVNLKLIERN